MGKIKMGFARLSPEERKAAAAKGGAAVPKALRSFSRNRELAKAAGAIGGRNIDPASRAFSRDRALAVEAGRKGGRLSRGGGRKKADA